jgi:hypothetical protein
MQTSKMFLYYKSISGSYGNEHKNYDMFSYHD